MSAHPVRVTMVVTDVLDVIRSRPDDDPAWGLRICELTGRGSGTVYPSLGRLVKAGWVADHWESPAPADRPRRRFYAMTAAGREEYAAVLESRASRRTAWVRATTGGTSD